MCQYRDSPYFMPYKVHSSLEPALSHEMPILLQVARHVFMNTDGCNTPF